MHRLRVPALLLALALAGVVALVAGAAPADAAAKRVVVLEWDGVENLAVLGVTPVGGADLAGYDHWVPVNRPSGITDVGLRQAPSLTRIASLRPDLIVAPDYRVTSNLDKLRDIAPVLVTHPYPGGSDSAQYNAMVTDFRRVAAAVGKKAKAEQVIAGLNAANAKAKATLKAKKRAGVRLTVALPGGTTSGPAVRIFARNSVPAELMRRVGLVNAWPGGAERYGYATVGVEAFRKVQNGWLAFIYPKEFEPIIKRFTAQDSFTRLQMVKKKRVRTLPGDTWAFGGPLSTRLMTERITAALTSSR